MAEDNLKELENGPWPKFIREAKEVYKTALQEAYTDGVKVEMERFRREVEKLQKIEYISFINTDEKALYVLFKDVLALLNDTGEDEK